MICQNCGTTLIEGAAFCQSCGTSAAPIKSEPEISQGNAYNEENLQLYCSNCGKNLSGQALFCSECGTPVRLLPDTSDRFETAANLLKTAASPQVTNASHGETAASPQPAYASLDKTAASPQPSHIPPHKPRKKKGLAIGLSVLILLVVAAAGLILTGIIPVSGPLATTIAPVKDRLAETAFVSNITAAKGRFLNGINDINPFSPKLKPVKISIAGDNSGSGIITKEPVIDAEQTVLSSGGTITVNKKGSPLNGMTIKVPAGAYPAETKFTVSSSEITGQGYNPALKFISPLINIENGGTYSSDIMTAIIPCVVPENSIPLAFYYHKEDNRLEYIPVLDYNERSVTIALRHFSTPVIGSFDKSYIEESNVIDTGFMPGVDDFSFVNRGSAIAPRGHCAGQSMAAIWYYKYLKASKGNLFGQYDNYGLNPNINFKTKDLQEDDVMAYRLASVTQKEFSVSGKAPDWNMSSWNALRTNDQTRFDQLCALMKFAGPQILLIQKLDNSKTISSFHAIVAYRVEGNKVYVADPNKPGKTDRYVEFNNGKFSTYSSADNAQALEAGNTVQYNMFFPFGETALVDFNQMKGFWEALDKRTIGDAYFPKVAVKLAIKVKTPDGEKEETLSDGYQANNKDFEFYVRDTGGMAYGLYLSNKDGKVKRLDDPAHPSADFKYTAELAKGDNYIGIALYKIEDSKNNWYDFQWLTIKYDSPTLDELVGEYPNGNIKVTEVFISQKIRDEAKAKAEKDAASSKSDFDKLGIGCDLKMIEELDKLKGQSFPAKFEIKKTAEAAGNIVTTSEDGKKTEIPFTYKDGVLSVSYDVSQNQDGVKNTLRLKGSLNATYGKKNDVVIDGLLRYSVVQRPDDFHMDQQLTGSRPLPSKKP